MNIPDENKQKKKKTASYDYVVLKVNVLSVVT